MGARKVAILAGAGALPRELAEAMRADGQPYFVAAIKGVAGDWIAAHPHQVFALGQVGALFDALRRQECDGIAFAGRLLRPKISALSFDWGGVRLAPRLARLMAKGDDGLLRGLAEIVEEQGVTVIAPQDFLAEALAPVGPMTRRGPSDEEDADAAAAQRVCAALGDLDVGQAVVAARGRCLAIEAAEGTAAMLERVAALPGSRRGETPCGVLFKGPKAMQDRRFDLPAIGPDTIEEARRAGLTGIALRARRVFVLERAETVRRAEAAKIALWGVAPEEAR